MEASQEGRSRQTLSSGPPQTTSLKLRLNFRQQTIRAVTSNDQTPQQHGQLQQHDFEATSGTALKAEHSESTMLESGNVLGPSELKQEVTTLNNDATYTQSTTVNENRSGGSSDQVGPPYTTAFTTTQSTVSGAQISSSYSTYASASGPSILDVFADWTEIYFKELPANRFEADTQRYNESSNRYLLEMNIKHPEASSDALTRKCPLPAELYEPWNPSALVNTSTYSTSTTNSTEPQPSLQYVADDTATYTEASNERGLKRKASDSFQSDDELEGNSDLRRNSSKLPAQSNAD